MGGNTTAALSRGRWWVAAALAAFIAVQLAVPVVGLISPRPAQFGWQMYSVAEAAAQAWGEMADGSRTPIDLVGRLAVLRADTRDADAIGHALCADHTYAAIILQFGDEPAERIPCS
ncbi:MAG: hypothetical protein M3P14_05485 [Chloroflexota bacterium]|nr:hypothetical protein [Chloroflexota bacterium]